jgi:hypothetical protein
MSAPALADEYVAEADLVEHPASARQRQDLAPSRAPARAGVAGTAANGKPLPPSSTHHCDGPWSPDSGSLVTSGGRLCREVCPHGRDRWQRVRGATLTPFVPPPWTPEFVRDLPGEPEPIEYHPQALATDPAECWFCRRATSPPGSRHGGLDPFTRNRQAAAENYQRRAAARRASSPPRR